MLPGDAASERFPYLVLSPGSHSYMIHMRLTLRCAQDRDMQTTFNVLVPLLSSPPVRTMPQRPTARVRSRAAETRLGRQVCESDFAKNLAEITTEEESAAAEYEDMTKANEIEKAAKDQDVKYKVKEAKELDKTAAELSTDRNGEQAELDAVLEYLAKLQDECIAKPEPFEDCLGSRWDHDGRW